MTGSISIGTLPNSLWSCRFVRTKADRFTSRYSLLKAGSVNLSVN